MNIFKVSLLVAMVSLTSACQPPAKVDQVKAEQHYICKSLIDGFLMATHNNQYSFLKNKALNSQQNAREIYTYSLSADNAVRLNIPTQRDLNFQCQLLAEQKYQVFILDPELNAKHQILNLDVPNPAEIKKLMAYAYR